MDVFEAVRTLLAVRRYRGEPVPEATVRRIVEAGRLTGSAMNEQPWHFVVVQDRETPSTPPCSPRSDRRRSCPSPLPGARPRDRGGSSGVTRSGSPSGGAFALLLQSAPGLALQAHAPCAFDLVAALSVGLAIFMMAATNTEHAPAAGTSLGLVLAGWSLPIVAFVLSAAAALSVTHQLLGHRLRDLI
jgi:hypothetical protein